MEEKRHSDEPTENRLLDTTERLWDRTRDALTSAAQRAGHYTRIVQKKIDLGTVHRRIHATHTDLGLLVDRWREAMPSEWLEVPEMQRLLHRLDDLKQQAAQLEHDLIELRAGEAGEGPGH